MNGDWWGFLFQEGERVSRVMGEMDRRGRGWTQVRGCGKQTVLGLLTRRSIYEAGSECGGSFEVMNK